MKRREEKKKKYSAFELYILSKAVLIFYSDVLKMSTFILPMILFFFGKKRRRTKSCSVPNKTISKKKKRSLLQRNAKLFPLYKE